MPTPAETSRSAPPSLRRLRIATAGILLMLVVAVWGCTAPRPETRLRRAAPGALRLELVGTAEIPGGERFGDTTVGGLSAIAYDVSRGEYLALSDDRGDREPPRFYTLEIELSRTGSPTGVHLRSVVPLRPASGPAKGYEPGGLDPEGLALAGDDVWIVSEGVARDGVAPFLRRFDRQGVELGELPLPAALTPAAGRGVRDNLGPESLTVSPDGSRLFLACEAALVQDGLEADVDRASLVRLLVYELAGDPAVRGTTPGPGPGPGRLAAQYLYRVEPVAVRPAEPDGFRVNGLVELLALDSTRLLALERAWASGGGYVLRLYEVDLAAAGDVSAIDALERAASRPAPVTKRLLLDLGVELAAAGVALDNLEGLSFGPRLADGRRTVVVVADDNFNQGEQRTLFVVLALSGLDDGPAGALAGR